MAGLDGIEREMSPPPPVNANIYRMSRQERISRGIDSLPESLDEAIAALKGSALMREALGEHIFNHFVQAKEIEWDIYRKQVHQWEIEQYLTVF